MLNLPKLYAITDVELSGLSHLEQVRRLIEGGASLIQLRDKTAPSGSFHNAAIEVMEYARRHDVKIVINDRVDIALMVGADGVHLGQDDLHPTRARKLLGKEKIIGFSTHSMQQAAAALTLPVDYIAIGPVFPTSTKRDHETVVGLEGVRAVRELIGSKPLVAIGGIDRSTAASVLDAGADTVAVIGDIISKPNDIPLRVREFLALTR